jgi:hypothetical protein
VSDCGTRNDSENCRAAEFIEPKGIQVPLDVSFIIALLTMTT